MNIFPKTALMLFLTLTAFCQASAQPRFNRINSTDPEFFKTEEARVIGDQIMAYQRITGGWPKNIDMARPHSKEELDAVIAQKKRTDDSTIDNNATNTQMTYLARLYQGTGDKKYAESFRKGLEYLLSGQYENGGWPQFWPDIPENYSLNITYNDNAIVNTLSLFKEILDRKEPYSGSLVDAGTRRKLQKSFDKGIDNILATQIVVDGEPTVWCQQNDPVTLKPAKARAYELPSFCSAESAGIVRLLMALPNPDERIKKAVHGAMKWFDKYKLTGLSLEYTMEPGHKRDVRLVRDPEAEPLWARFYDLEYNEPYVCDRDGLPRRHLEQIGIERRTGYSWFNRNAAELYPLYETWADRFDPKNKVAISLSTKGANENGLIDMFRRHKMDPADFDVVVKPGESIQDAISKAPADGSRQFKILVLKGAYRQKVIIDRPNIVLVGEDKDNTVISLAETAATREITEYNGKPVGNGVIVLQEGADDCIISGLTVYNDYGVAVEGVTSHQMAIFGRATRTIIVNCNVWAAGNDALSLWAPEGNGMYYHADLDVRCLGVDFLCPRGWCYVTRSSFFGAGHALIWHDGRGDRSKRLVIKDSRFDAMLPTTLGRYHHDSQFFLINCELSRNILDENIHYAYTDKVLDPCPWGLRAYYYGCVREGGDSGWLRDNLQTSETPLPQYAMTAKWTFNNQWDPEKVLQDIWDIIEY